MYTKNGTNTQKYRKVRENQSSSFDKMFSVSHVWSLNTSQVLQLIHSRKETLNSYKIKNISENTYDLLYRFINVSTPIIYTVGKIENVYHYFLNVYV